MRLSQREIRGVDILFEGNQINRVDDLHYRVSSQCGVGVHVVEWRGRGWKCTCLDFLETETPCKHFHAVAWGLALPVVLMANKGIVGGHIIEDPVPFIYYLGRPVRVKDLVGTYRKALPTLRDLEMGFPRKLPPPRFTKNNPTDPTQGR
jgi:hypothetical protein